MSTEDENDAAFLAETQAKAQKRASATRLLHVLWTRAVGTPGYDKSDWKDFRDLLGLHDAPGGAMPAAAIETPADSLDVEIVSWGKIPAPKLQLVLKTLADSSRSAKDASRYADALGLNALRDSYLESMRAYDIAFGILCSLDPAMHNEPVEFRVQLRKLKEPST